MTPATPLPAGVAPAARAALGLVMASSGALALEAAGGVALLGLRILLSSLPPSREAERQ